MDFGILIYMTRVKLVEPNKFNYDEN